MEELISRRKNEKTRWLFIVVSSLIALSTASCRRPGQPAAVAHRVVTLSPSLTEILFALQAGDRVVGVSDYCDFPPEVKSRAKVGSFLSPSVERIVALQPDLVLLDGVQRDIAAALTQAGARALAVPMQDLSEVRAAIKRVGEALGDKQDAAAALVAEIDQRIAEVKKKTAQAPRRRALFVVDRQIGGLRGLVVAGPGTYLDELLRLAGGENVFSDLKARYAKVATEAILERRPEVILDAVHVESGQADALRRDWQELAAVPAVRDGQIYVLADRQFVTPGPRLGESLEKLAALLHPEAFSRR
jgi:iron complex transport system substrate-binding protein